MTEGAQEAFTAGHPVLSTPVASETMYSNQPHMLAKEMSKKAVQDNVHILMSIMGAGGPNLRRN